MYINEMGMLIVWHEMFGFELSFSVVSNIFGIFVE